MIALDRYQNSEDCVSAKISLLLLEVSHIRADMWENIKVETRLYNKS